MNNTMSTEKHTPGPWFIPTPSQDAFGDYVIQSGANGGYGVIATTNPKGIDRPDANARLIAAAPDLLAACKNLSAALQGAIHDLKNASSPLYGAVNPYNRFPLLGKMEVTLNAGLATLKQAEDSL